MKPDYHSQDEAEALLNKLRDEIDSDFASRRKNAAAVRDTSTMLRALPPDQFKEAVLKAIMARNDLTTEQVYTLLDAISRIWLEVLGGKK